jgi:hypothetical protein
LWWHQKKCNPHLPWSVCSFIYVPKVNCPHFQFVTFTYPTCTNCILLCNPQCLNALPCSSVVSCLLCSCPSPIMLCLVLHYSMNYLLN